MEMTDQWVRDQFPLFGHQQNLVYLDSAATSQKPLQVINRIRHYQEKEHANIHRGVYDLSMEATASYDKVRSQVKYLIGAESSDEIVFTKGTTDALNLVAFSLGMVRLNPGDEVVISQAEHHSNILPWQQITRLKGAKLVYLPVDEVGRIEIETSRHLISERTKIVSVTMVSNALGTIQPVRDVIKRAREVGALVVLDGAQAVPHSKVHVGGLDTDFLVFSSHKMFGPTGVGVLYGKKHLLEEMVPYQTGGDMIEYVEEQTSTFAPVPQKFEAGTPNIEGVVGFGEAITFMEQLGIGYIHDREMALTQYGLEVLSQIPHVRIHGPASVKERGPVISFSVEDVHPHDVTTILNQDHIAIRAGHHCAQPLMKRLGLPSTNRISFGIYNTQEDVDRLAKSLMNVRRWLGYES